LTALHVIVLSAAGLQRVVRDYVAYYLHSRTHLGLGPNRPHEPFSDPICLRRLKCRSNNTHVLGLEHRAKAARKLAIAIANQKPNWLLPLNESPRVLPRLLRDPRMAMCRAAGHVDATAGRVQ
jgi:hypothetical protein